ncbi:MAG: PKD domain-containing protein, partial [Bacteroidetes bacterium]
YNAAGTYAVTLQALSSTGCTSAITATQVFTIFPPTVADFNVPSTTTICTGTNVTFNDNSTSGAASYAWSFAGAASPTSSTAQNPVITYTASGTYNTTLTVTYPNGCVRTITKPYTVTVNPAPNANFTNAPNNGFCQVPKTVTFTPLQANNPNYTYTWNFGQPIGPGLTGPIALGYTGVSTYTQFGSYNVSLTVKDNITGCETIVTRVLTLQEPVLSIAPRNPVTGCAPLNVIFDVSMNAIESIASYQIDYEGNGTFTAPIVPTHNPPTPFTLVSNYTYTTRGTFIPKIRITTTNGCTIQVNSLTPINVGIPPVITSITRTGGSGGNCQGGTGFVYTPVFQAGTSANTILVSYGGAPAIPYIPGTPFPFQTNGSQTITYTASDNGCLAAPISFSGAGIGGQIEDPFPSITVNGGVPNICSGGSTNTFSVNISASVPSPNGTTNYIVDFAGTQYSSLTPTAPNNPFDPANVQHTFTSPGTYTITVIANNPSSGCSASSSVQVTVIQASGFVVDFNVTTPTPTCAFNPITFDASASTSSAPGVTITNYQWNFGDGSPIFITNNPVTNHTYVPSATPYTAGLTVLFSNGCTKTYTGVPKTVNIQGPIPVIAVSPTINGCVGDTKNFAGSLSGIFPNTNSVANPSGWTWNFGDVGSVGNIVNGQNSSHTFVNPGTYTVTLTVRDNNTLTSLGIPGCLATATVQVQIFPKPTVSFTALNATCVGNPTTFTSSVTGAPPLTYAWDFDGNLGTIESNVPNPTYTFTSPATPGNLNNQLVTLTVTNANGCFQTFTRNISVINPDFAIGAVSGAFSAVAPANLILNCPPKNVNFTANSIPAGLDLTNWTFDWTFGDGNQAVNVQNPSNIYDTPRSPDVFNVLLTAKNIITGCIVTKTLNNFITISGPRGVFDFVPKFSCKPDVVTFTVGPFTGSPTKVTMDFGDGTSQTIGNNPTPLPSTVTFTHTYTQSGTFLPIMTLEDASGCRVAYPSAGNVRVNVSGPPVANFTWTGGGQICRNILVNFSDLSSSDAGTPNTSPLNPQVNRWDWAIYPAGTPIPPVNTLPLATPLFTSTSQNTAYTFTASGTYLVRLSVKTAFNQGGTPDGCPDTEYKTITIVDPSITAAITTIAPPNRCPGEPVTFNGNGNTNINPKILQGVWRVYQNPVGVNIPYTTPPALATINATATAGANPPDPWTMAGNYTFSAAGTYTLELVVTDVALCTGGAVATQLITVDPLPTFAPASGPTNQAICVNQSASFTVNPSAASLAGTGVTYQWQQNDGGGWVNIIDGPLVGGLAPAIYAGSATSSFTITNGSLGINNYQYRCVIRKTLTATCVATSNSATLSVNQNPTLANAGPAQTLCNVTSVTLAGNDVSPFTGQWTQVGGPTLPLGSIVNSSLFNTQVNNLSIGIYTFRWTSSSGACSSNFADVVVTNARTASVGATQNLCGASSTSLTANNPALFGGTGVWSLFSGPLGVSPTITPTNSFNTSVTGLVPSTTPYIFRWTTSGPGCANNSFADITINDNPLPSAVNPMSQTICQGQTTTFVTSGAGTLSYQWQADDNGGSGFVNIANTAPYSGVTTQTLTVTNPALTFNNYKYRVRVTNGTTGCVTFTNSGTLAIQAAPLGAPTTTAPAFCQGSPIVISLTNTSSGYTYQLFTGATPVAGVPSITGNGTGQSFATFTANTSASYTVVVTTPQVNGVSCTQNLTPTLNLTVNPTPSASVAGANQVVCAATTNMNATPVASGTGTWTIIAGSGSITAGQQNSPTASITGLVAGVTTTLQWTVTSGAGVGACPPNVSTVNVTRLSATATSNAGADQTLCAVATALQGSNPGAGTGTWSVIAGSGTFANANDRFTTVTNLGIGTNTFRWTVVDACGTTTDDVNIIREFGNTFADAGPNVIQCGATTILSAVGTPAAAARTWTLAPGTSLVSGTLTSPTITITGLALGANVFTWTVTNSCATSISNVTITRIDNTTPSNAGIAQNICGASTSLNANIPVVGTGTWSFVSGPVALTNANFSNVNQNNANVTGMTAVGTYRFQWTISNGACTPSSTFVDITRDALPSASVITAIPDICADNTTITANNPAVGTGLWSVVSAPSGANPTFVNANNNSTIINGLTVAGTYTIKWTITNGTCPPAQSTATIVRASPPSVSNAGVAQTICADVVTLNANLPTSGTGLWTVTTPLGATVTFSNATANNTTASGLTVAGNYTFTWTISNAPCTPASTSSVIITRNANIGAVTITPSTINVCGATTTLTASALPVGTTGVWTIVQGNGTFSPANNPNTTVSGLSAGLNRFRWTVTSGVCPQVSADVIVNSFTQPSPANAGPDVLVCSGSGTLTASTPTAGTGTWSYVGTAPSGLSFGNINSPNTTVSGLPVGSHTLRWTVDNLPCTSSNDDVLVSVRGSVSLSVAGTSQTTCNTNWTLGANPVNVAAGETGVWTFSGGTIAPVNLNNPNAPATLVLGVNSFTWTVNNGCATSVSTIFITRVDNTTTANAGTNQDICINDVNLAGNQPAIGTGLWTANAGNPSAVTFANASQFNTAVSGLSVAGDYFFTWTITNGTCTPSSSIVRIRRLSNPSVANIGTSAVSVCADNYTITTGTNPTIGTGLWSVVSGSGTFSNSADVNTQISNLANGVNVFKWTVSNSVCVPTTATITITRALPPTTSVAGTNASICADSYTLNGNAPSVGTGQWTLQPGFPAGAVVTFNNNTLSNAVANGLTLAGTYTFRWTITNAPCTPSTSDVIITRLAAPTANAGTNITQCGGQIFMNATGTPLGNGTWSVVAGNGTFANPNSPTTEVTGMAQGLNRYRWTVTNGTCVPATSEVIVNYSAPLSNAYAGADVVVCDVNGILNATAPAVGNGQWVLISPTTGTLPAIANPNSPNSAVSGLVLGDNIFEWRVSNAICTTPNTDQVILTRRGNTVLSNAGTSSSTCLSTFALNANIPNALAGEVGTWTVAGGASIAAIDLNNPNATATLAMGANSFTWTVVNGCATATSTITITRTIGVTPSIAGNNQSICANTTTLNGNIPSAGTGQWIVTSVPAPLTLASVTFVDSFLATTQVNGLTQAGNYILTWRIDNGACGVSQSNVQITVTQQPSASVITTAPTNICVNNINLQATAPTIGNGQWSVVAAPIGSLPVFANANSNNTNVTGLDVAGNYTFAWTISNGICPNNQTTITITRDLAPSIANAGSDQTICVNNVTLSGNNPVVGVGTWSVSPSAGVLFGNINQFNTSVTGLSTAGTYTFTWTISNGTCTVNASTMVVNRLASPSVAFINPTPSNICSNTITSLTAQAITSGTGQWSVVSLPSGSTVAFGTPTAINTSVSGMSVAGSYTFAWTVSNGSCVANVATVSVTRDAIPTQSLAGANQTICSDNNITLNGNTPLIGTGSWSAVSVPLGASVSFTSGTQGNAIASGFTFAGTYKLRWTISNGTCNVLNGTASTSDVIITRLDSPSAAFINPTPSNICSNTITSLTAQAITSGTGQWSVVSLPVGSTVTFGSPNTTTTSVNGMSVAGGYTFAWTVSNGSCTPNVATVSVTRDATPSVANAGSDQTICVNNVTLNGNNPAVGVGTWSVTPSAGVSFGNVNQFNTSVTGLSTAGAYTFTWTIANGTCTS